MRADNSRHVTAAARHRAEQTRERAVAAAADVLGHNGNRDTPNGNSPEIVGPC